MKNRVIILTSFEIVHDLMIPNGVKALARLLLSLNIQDYGCHKQGVDDTGGTG